ncbi:ATP-binding protein [Neobacillus muris]|uniref:ATP-binding protein n=1 Tax=Neobacillus muris TaxID=2941334 RepID=UPI002040F2FC|nr:ATP-binding protein [Neobacillus muris]
MFLLDYIINLSIFSLLVSIPLIIQSFININPIKHVRIWGGVYAGIVSVILIELSFQQQGYTYDIRYSAIILSFAYLGPIPGLIAGVLALMTRLAASGHWAPAIIGWAAISAGCLLVHWLMPRIPSAQKTFILYGVYLVIYGITVPGFFHVFRGQPLFHFQYVLFVLLGVILGVLLIESYLKLYRLNDRLKAMYKLVEESESNYRLIAENTSDLIKVMDKDHRIRYFSPSHKHVLGYELEELEGMELIGWIHPDDAANFGSTIQLMFEKKQFYSMEFRFRHKDGRFIEFESRCMPVKGEHGSIEHIVIVSRDISERKKSEEMLLQSEKLSIVGELAAGVAHEIRNPLTTIKGFVQLYKAQNVTFEYSDLLLNELERIEAITSEMLTLGKPQAVKLVLADARELIESTVELISPQALMNGVEIRVTAEESGFFITCEQNQLKQVFLNLFKNAIEAMPGGGKIQVQLRKGEEGICMVSIKDQGCGIPAEILPRLGEPFYTLKEKGTGLGIMICTKIIKQHHGTITFESKENEGTLVQIQLPLAG